jgi:thiamine kinase-like enzyme
MEGPIINVVIDEADFASAKRVDPKAYQQRVEVLAKGKTFSEKSIHPKGAWWSKELKNTDEELVNKFIENASIIFSVERAKKMTKIIFRLDELDNIVELMAMLVKA